MHDNSATDILYTLGWVFLLFAPYTIHLMKPMFPSTFILPDYCFPEPECPIVGQVYDECGSACPATCANPDPQCTAVCSPGCHCPVGQVIDEESESCVAVEKCPGK